MNSKSRITYRFDRKDGTRIEQQPTVTAPSDVVPFFQEELKFSTDAGTWKSPFQDDAFALEQLIRESEPAEAPVRNDTDKSATEASPAAEEVPLVFEQEAPFAFGDGQEEAAPVSADWPRKGPVIEDGVADASYAPRTHGFKVSTSYRPSRGPSWLKVFASVAGAVATGAIFGYLLLTLFFNGGTVQGETTPVSGVTSADDAAAKVEEPGKAAGNADKGTAGKAAAGSGKINQSVAVNLPAVSYQMLQYGVFSNREGMEEATAELHGQGWAAAELVTPEDYRVYTGISKLRENAVQLSGKLADKDIYIKEVEVPALTNLVFQGEAATAKTFFQHTEALFDALDSFTASKMGPSAQAGKDWKEAHRKWTQILPEMEAGVQDEQGKNALHKMVQSLNNAAVAAGEYEKKASDAHLWEIQNALMETIIMQKSWFASIDAL